MQRPETEYGRKPSPSKGVGARRLVVEEGGLVVVWRRPGERPPGAGTGEPSRCARSRYDPDRPPPR